MRAACILSATRRAAAALAATVLCGAGTAGPTDKQEPIVVAMSYGSGATAMRSSSVAAGVKAYIERVNAQGGVGGRPLRVEVADNPGDPAKHAENLRAVARERGAVAILACAGDEACQVSAQVATELRLPLIAPLSGLSTLSRQQNPMVYRVRAGYTREADSIATQLTNLACTKIVLLTDAANVRESDQVMQRAMEHKGLKVELVRVDTTSKANLASLLKKLGAGNYHAAVLNLSVKSVENIIEAGISNKEEWPRVLMTPSNGTLPAMVAHFKGRILGFSQVVPNPELLANPLSRDLEQDADKYASALALTLDGMEAYLGARLLVEGLRRSGPKPTPERLADVLAAQDQWLINGFRLSFAANRETGSDWVDIGLRSRTGTLVR